jgi:hypothetical protein
MLKSDDDADLMRSNTGLNRFRVIDLAQTSTKRPQNRQSVAALDK